MESTGQWHNDGCGGHFSEYQHQGSAKMDPKISRIAMQNMAGHGTGPDLGEPATSNRFLSSNNDSKKGLHLSLEIAT